MMEDITDTDLRHHGDHNEEELSHSREHEQLENNEVDWAVHHDHDNDGNDDNDGDQRIIRHSEEDDQHNGAAATEGEGFSIYVTNLNFQTTEDMLREAFEPYGVLSNIQIVKEPLTGNSRGFGFVRFIEKEAGEKALESMVGVEVNGRVIQLEKSRRTFGYDKTPGRYMGPPQSLSRRPTTGRDGGYVDRGGRGGGGRGRGGGRGYYDEPRYDRGGDSYGGGGSRYYEDDRRGGRGGGGGHRDDYRYADRRPVDRYPPSYPDRYVPDDRYSGDRYRDPYPPRREGPPPGPRYDSRRGYERERGDSRGSGSGSGYDRYDSRGAPPSSRSRERDFDRRPSIRDEQPLPLPSIIRRDRYDSRGGGAPYVDPAYGDVDRPPVVPGGGGSGGWSTGPAPPRY